MRAVPAPARRVDGDPVAGLQPGGPIRDLDDLARDLVAERQGRLHDEIAGPAVPEVVHVGAADPAGAELHAHHPGGERRRRRLDHAQVFGPEQRRRKDGLAHFVTPIVRGSQSVSSGM